LKISTINAFIHFEILISLFGKISSAGKRVEPDWTPILLRKNFKIKGFTKFKELVWGLDWTFHKYF
jgi:hypothetical protein